MAHLKKQKNFNQFLSIVVQKTKIHYNKMGFINSTDHRVTEQKLQNTLLLLSSEEW